MWQFLGHACKITDRKRESEHYVYVWELTGYSCKGKKKHYLTEKGEKWAGCVWKWHHKFCTKGHPNPKPLLNLDQVWRLFFTPSFGIGLSTFNIYIYQEAKMNSA